MSIELSNGLKHREDVKQLFREYTDMLISNDNNFANYLNLQNYDDELENLEVKYGLPFGRLYLIYYNKELAGCIALRKINSKLCEMKRLYIWSQFRSKGLGTHLVKKIISDATEIGYSAILLDTLPFLQDAIKLYKNFGFYEIESYNNSPMDNLIYLRLDL